MRFRIPRSFQESVRIVRRSAYDAEAEAFVAEVVCMIVPKSDLVPRSEGVSLDVGVPITRTGWIALLEQPNADIVEGDILRRSDGREYRVIGSRHLHRSVVMQIELNEQGVL